MVDAPRTFSRTSRFTIDDQEGRSGVRQRSAEDVIDGPEFVDLFSACSKALRNGLHVQAGGRLPDDKYLSPR